MNWAPENCDTEQTRVLDRCIFLGAFHAKYESENYKFVYFLMLGGWRTPEEFYPPCLCWLNVDQNTILLVKNQDIIFLFFLEFFV